MIPDFYSSWPNVAQIIFYIASIVVGVFLLVKCCDIFVGSASSLAKKLHIAPMIIGLTVVAMGTSLPELAVSVSDSINCLKDGGNANVAIGNVVGSNICNILIVLGGSILFTPIFVKKEVLKKNFPFLIVATIMCIIFTLTWGLGGSYAILRWEGIILVAVIIGYIAFLVIDAIRHPQEENEEEIKDMKIWKAILLIIVGGVGIALGGELVVIGAKNLAIKGATAAGFNIDLTEALVGLTIVAVGTSLPELVTSLVAAKKGENDIALGNVIGSNIFNILFVLGIASTVNPLTTGNQILIDLIVMGTITFLLFGLSFTGKLDKKIGILFLSIYAIYLTYLILRTVGVIPSM